MLITDKNILNILPPLSQNPQERSIIIIIFLLLDEEINTNRGCITILEDQDSGKRIPESIIPMPIPSLS